MAKTIMKMNIRRTMAMKDDAEDTSTSPIFRRELRYLNTLNNLKTLKDLRTLKLSMDLRGVAKEGD